MEKPIRRYINNVFAKDDYHCFACSPTNEIGLRLHFFEEGDYVQAEWKPSKEYEGYPGTIHGGIQSTLLDEIGAWTLISKERVPELPPAYKCDIENSWSLHNRPC